MTYDDDKIDWIVLAVMGTLILFILMIADCTRAIGAHPPGTILVSRNADERENTSPGYWNHLACVVSDTHVVESQECQGVIKTPLCDYLARDYSKILALKPRDARAGARAARRAMALCGLPDRQLSSLFLVHGPRRQKLGLNCVTAAAEIPWAYENPRIRLLVFPDGIFRYGTFQAPEVVR